MKLAAQIRGFHAASEGTYGASQIRADLHEAGVAVSRKTVAKLIRADGITGISPRAWRPPTTARGADPFPVPDLIERQFDQGVRDAAWFSDITYLRTGGGWVYLCVLRDGHTRRVLGRTGACGDNATAESFWPVFKNEYYHRHAFATIDAARRGAYTWIDGWYNARRRRSGIGYISPLDHERRQLTLAA